MLATRRASVWSTTRSGVGRRTRTLAEDELPLPTYQTMWQEFPITWSDRIRVARGELAPEEARLSKTGSQADFTRGPHDFVALPWISKRLHQTKPQAHQTTHRLEFPRHVLVLSRTRAWLREDVEAYP